MPGFNFSNSLWQGKTGLWDGNTGLWCGVSGLALVSESLFLNFLAGAPLDSRITFSRGSQATLTDSTGKITYAPNNLLTNSQDFEASAWPKQNATVTSNTAVAPDGTMTADKLVEDATNTSHRMYQTAATAFSNGATVVNSVYLKAAERTWGYVRLELNDNTSLLAWFNLATGTLGTVQSGLTASITSVGNGWYRCSIAGSVGTGATPAKNYFLVGVTTGDGVQTYTGTAGSGIYVWGAQLEQVTYQTTPGTYNSTTPKNLLGYTQEFDNAAWTKSNAFVQTNLLTYSEAFNNAIWTLDNSGAVNPVVTADYAVAPNGTMTADRIVLNKTGGLFSRIYQSPTVSSAIYTFSVWMRTTSGTGTANVGLRVDTTGINCAVTGVWQRFQVTMSAASTTPISQILLFDSIPGNDETADILAWGAQLVQGATAGNYQPTYAAAAAVQYAAPDGSTTADKVVETSGGSHRVYQNIATLGGTTPYTYTIYAKAAERSQIWFRQLAETGDTNGVLFDLAAGTATITGGITSASITAVGNGWYRCAAVSVPTGGATSGLFYFALAVGGVISYAGDGTSGVYVWGAQVSNSASLDLYVYNPGAAPTSAAYYGPRFDYAPVTLAAKGLLIEEQRTNLPLYSEQFENVYWNKANSSVTANAAVSPDGSTNADKLVENTATSTHTIGVTLIAGSAVYTYSVYVKAAGRSVIRFRDSVNGVDGYFDLNTATSPSGTGVNRAITSVGNGWYRCTMTSSAAITNPEFGVRLATAVGTENYTGDGTSGVYLYGAQLEAGAFATSYIPTVASQVTRSADSALMQGANFSNWYNQNEGTFAVNADTISATTGHLYSADDGTSSNRIYSIASPGSTVFSGIVTSGSTVYSQSIGSVVSNVPFKSATAYNLNDCNSAVGGTIGTTDTSATMPVVSRFRIGQNVATVVTTGHFRTITYYNTRLGNSTLQALTT